MNSPQTIRTVLVAPPRIELNNQGKVLEFNLTDPYHQLGRSPHHPFPIGLTVPHDWTVISRCQACFRKIGQDYYIYDGDGEHPSSNRLFFNQRIVTPQKGHCLNNGDRLTIGHSPQHWVTLTYTDGGESQQTPTVVPKQRRVSLKHKSVVLGRSADANLQLDAPIVSRHHAVIDSDSRGRYVLSDRSANGTFVNGVKVQDSMVLPDEAMIRIGPFALVLQGDELVLSDYGENIRLDVKHLTKEVRGKDKQKLSLLQHISLAIEPGQLVALVGGSGTGKSTLMKMLLGIEPATAGVIYLNGDNLRQYFNVYRHLIGYVPQSDIIHTNLTVWEVLYYAARLRLPPDIEIQELIEKTLHQTELQERRHTLVRNLSGGQLKRVSIGVELLADPKLFFLDEPTSGLDPGLDKKMMQLLRRLADEGRTIILVTHATSNITLCDRLVFLGLGGHLCYYGPPEKAIVFFQVDSTNFADIYIKLETRESVKEEAERYVLSNDRKEYIDNRLIGEENVAHPTASKQSQGDYLRQLSVLIRRYCQLIVREPVYLVLSLLTAPIGIALVTLAVPHSVLNTSAALKIEADTQALWGSLARQVLFIISCAAMWAGFASSLQEIVKESAIYLRERLVNLSLLAYLSSKVLTLAGLAVLQSLVITLVVRLGFQPPGDVNFIPASLRGIPWSAGVFLTTLLTISAAFSLGLMVSASVKNSTQANSALPLLLLPQIIFSGVLFDIGDTGKYITWLMLSRWSIGAYGSLANVNSIVPPLYKEVLKRPKMFGNPEPNLESLVLNWLILLVHILVYLAIALWLQKRKDIKS